jgi:hypothetical protein
MRHVRRTRLADLIEMSHPPTRRMRELERLLAKLRKAGNIELSYDMWERWGSQHASPEEREAMQVAMRAASRERSTATPALEALVATTRREAPSEVAAWAGAHEAYLAAFLEDCAARGESAETAAHVANRERAEWAEVRAGTRAFVEENVFYVSEDAARYRQLFGIDPKTLEDVE